MVAAPSVALATAEEEASRPSRAMEAGRPSRTAQGAALLRAAHQLLDDPTVFSDPLALTIIGQRARATLEAEPGRYASRQVLRAFIALRSRYAEDQLALAAARGISQYVVLGAGLDTFAYRNPHAEVRVFEVDHPATQQWKHERLREGGIAIPYPSPFAPCDFESQSLGQALQAAGFDESAPAFFSMLGVAVYLTPDALRETLAYVASLPTGSEIVFSYSVAQTHLTPGQKSARAASEEVAAAIGEPWLSYYEPGELARQLEALGFGTVSDLNGKEANRRYFGGREDGLRVSSSARLISARV